MRVDLQTSAVTCPVFTEYFLEDAVRMLDFVPTAEGRKRSRGDKEELPGEEDDENMNKKVSADYPPKVRNAMSLLSEKEISFELIEVCSFCY